MAKAKKVPSNNTLDSGLKVGVGALGDLSRKLGKSGINAISNIVELSTASMGKFRSTRDTRPKTDINTKTKSTIKPDSPKLTRKSRRTAAKNGGKRGSKAKKSVKSSGKVAKKR